MNKAKHILIIAYHFPPLTGGGVFRPLKFVKYLPEFGWQPLVLSVWPGDDDLIDPELLSDVPASVPIFRSSHWHPKHIERLLSFVWTVLWKARLRFLARRLEPYKVMHWFVPDVQFSWLITGFLRARQLIRHYHPDVVMTTAPPFTAHLIGLWLRAATGIPWIADYRDPWSQNPFITFPTSLHRTANQQLDRQVLQKADLLINATSAMTEDMTRFSDFSDASKFHTVWNGFDQADFESNNPVSNQPEEFVISHVGALYGLRRAGVFLEAVNTLVETGQIPDERLKVRFIGKDGTGETQQYADKSWFEYREQLPHREAVEAMYRSACLLLIVNQESSAQVPGKVFEYLATGRPILALAPPDSPVANIVKRTCAGIVVQTNDTAAISDVLMTFFRDWRENRLSIQPKKDIIATFERRQQTQKLAQLADSLLPSGAMHR